MRDERATVQHSLPPVLARGGLLSMYYRVNFRVRLWKLHYYVETISLSTVTSTARGRATTRTARITV
jgi:hypothetical protein